MTAVMGHNVPDIAAEERSRLLVDYPNLDDLIGEFGEAAERAPQTIETKADHDEVADLIARLRTIRKTVETYRESEKEPHLKRGRAVDGFFSEKVSALAKIAMRLTSTLETYLRKKADEERKERERVAAEQRRIAEDARREEAERQRRAEESRRADYRAIHADAAVEAGLDAALAEARAEEASHAASAKPSELARTRSDHGSLSTLKAVWTFSIDDADAIPLNELRPYIGRDAIEKALRSYVRVHKDKRPLAGVSFFESDRAVVR